MKRATSERMRTYVSDAISIHALVKRATTGIKILDTLIIDFNPRPREEGDKK